MDRLLVCFVSCIKPKVLDPTQAGLQKCGLKSNFPKTLFCLIFLCTEDLATCKYCWSHGEVSHYKVNCWFHSPQFLNYWQNRNTLRIGFL